MTYTISATPSIPKRRVHYFDVSQMTPCQAEEFMQRMRDSFKWKRAKKPRFQVELMEL